MGWKPFVVSVVVDTVLDGGPIPNYYVVVYIRSQLVTWKRGVATNTH